MSFITDEVLNRYKRYLKEEEKSQATMEKYPRDMKKFRECLCSLGEHESDENQFDKRIVLEYERYLDKCYKTTSANSMLAAIDSFLEYLGCEECKVKLFKIQHIQFSKPEKELTEKDYGRLVRTAERRGDARMSMLSQTIGSTGIRISELRFITVESLECGRAEACNEGKSKIALLPAELMKLLEEYYRRVGITGGSIFVTRNRRPMDRGNINKKMKELGREAGMDKRKVFPHNFRHLLARTLYRMERDMMRLAGLLGHSDINTTRVYTVDTESRSRRQLSRAHLVYSQTIGREIKNTP